MKELDLVKKNAVDAFISQFGKNASTGIKNPNDYDIIYIDSKPSLPMAFEIYHKVPNIKIRLRVYMELGKTDYLEPFTLAVTNPAYNNQLGDEVFITSGYFAESNIKALDLDYKKLVPRT